MFIKEKFRTGPVLGGGVDPGCGVTPAVANKYLAVF